MSIPGFGDAVGLFDVSQRIISFINDLRHAQDDLLGLASEAHALRICINAVTSNSCHNTLYHHIDKKQGRDLRAIIDVCNQNLKDLNKFVGSVAALIEEKGRADGILPKKLTHGTKLGAFWALRKTWGEKLRRLWAKCWAAYKFTMADKQAYRDKLVLPMQSINVFLTSMTHVGIVNIGRFGVLPSDGGRRGLSSSYKQPLALPAPDAALDDGGGYPGGQLGGWEVVGSQIAFKRPSFLLKGDHLTSEFEAEVLLYAKHLLKGGDKFSFVLEKRQRHFRVTKTPIDKSTGPARSRSRARSQSRPAAVRRRDQMSLGRDAAGMFVRRRKSVVVPATVETEDLQPGRPLLALPAPDANIIEIQPSDWQSDSDDGRGSRYGGNDGGSDGRGGGGGGPSRGRRPPSRATQSDDGSPQPLRSDRHAKVYEADSPHEDPQTSSHTRSRWHDRATYRHSQVTDLEDRQREIEARIQREQEEAINLLERSKAPERMRRSETLRRETRMSEAERENVDEYYDLADSMRYLDETYGLIVTYAGDRPAVDNGAVGSDDESITFDPELARADKLRAETSIPSSSRTFFEEGPGFSRRSESRRKPDPSMYAAEASFSRSRMRSSRMHQPASMRQEFPAETLYPRFDDHYPAAEEYRSFSPGPHERHFQRPYASSPVRSPNEEREDFVIYGASHPPRRRSTYRRSRSRSPLRGGLGDTILMRRRPSRGEPYRSSHSDTEPATAEIHPRHRSYAAYAEEAERSGNTGGRRASDWDDLQREREEVRRSMRERDILERERRLAERERKGRPIIRIVDPGSDTAGGGDEYRMGDGRRSDDGDDDMEIRREG